MSKEDLPDYGKTTDLYTNQLRPAKQRLDWIDYAKGIGIFLVVTGHTLRGLINSSILTPSPIAIFVDQWIYTFHMPLFFFLSGLFIERSASKPFKNFLVDKFQVIVYPYLIWSIIQTFLQIATSSYTNSQQSVNNIWAIIYNPVMQFWFLYVLFLIMIIYKFLYQVNNSNIYFILSAIALYCTHIFGISLGSWGVVYQVRVYVIYFAIGIIISSLKLLSSLYKINIPILITITLSGYLLIAIAVESNLTNYKLTALILALIGISASFTLSILLNKLNIAQFLKFWGNLSLQIYVAHTIASALIRIVLLKMFHVSDPTFHILLGISMGIYVPIIIDIFSKRIGFKYIFTLRPSF